MSDLQDLIAGQEQTTALISRIVVNMRKKGEPTFMQIEVRIQLLESYWTQYCERHLQIASTAGAAGTDYVKEEHFEMTQEEFIERKAELQALLQGGDVRREGRPRTGGGGGGVKARLPKLDLPQFNGDKLNWESFRDLFTSLVVDSTDLSPVNKLQYLKMALIGEPASLIRNVPVTEANWDSAWETLTKRYDDKRSLLNAYLSHFLTMKTASQESSAELKRILDTVQESKRGLTNLKRPVHKWDDWFVHIAVSRLDPSTRKGWEFDQDSSEFSTVADLEKFLLTRIRALEAVPPQQGKTSEQVARRTTEHTGSNRQREDKWSKEQVRETKPTKHVSAHPAQAQAAQASTSRSVSCFFCNEKHILVQCSSFRESPIAKRLSVIQEQKLCMNCLGRHALKDCSSDRRCRTCGELHHTLVHEHFEKAVSNSVPVVTATPCTTVRSCQVILATVNVRLVGKNGQCLCLKALLDPAAEANFISDYAVQQLSLKRRPVGVTVDGIGGCKPEQPKHAVLVQFNAASTETSTLEVEAYVLKNVLAAREPVRLPFESWSHLDNLSLADPDYASGCRPEMILGVAVYANVIRSGLVRGPPGTPIAQETSLGWVILGQIAQTPAPEHVQNLPCLIDTSISDQLRLFWEIEEIVADRPLSEEEQACEDLFRTTHERDEQGRYVVRLPRREQVQIGESRFQALKSLQHNERRRRNNEQLDRAYVEFMNEYESLHHMEEVGPNSKANFLPHHAVYKGDKIRVVFNAAAVTSSGHSLNSALMTGPRLQSEVDEVLLNWRRYPIVFTADIVKMFRGILVHPSDRDLQRILWRKSQNEPVKEYLLRTVTYGTSCAPWLAIRTLHQLAADEKEQYPLGAEILLEESYIDDFFFGADDVSSAVRKKNELIGILTAGGFQLAKWASNKPDLIVEQQPVQNIHDLVTSEVVKTLGVYWDSGKDTFGYNVTLTSAVTCSKRAVLSQIARVYDPLGWLGPITITAKIFMQRLWILHEDWDTPLPDSLADEWVSYYEQLADVSSISLPRWIGLTADATYELHGFCDSSETAYAACVYIRVTDNRGVRVTLLAAKTKVSPIKTVTVPRLELCGAVLLCRLMNKVLNIFPIDPSSSASRMYTWTDSTVVLAWLQGHPSRWRNFVANRVSDIHQRLPNTIWRHVRTWDNPADLATRGIKATELRDCELWWQGPWWLREPSEQWPLAPTVTTEIEMRNTCRAVVAITEQPWDLLGAYSSLTRVLRITAFCRRFSTNAKTEKTKREFGPLTVQELDWALNHWIKVTQQQYFAAELQLLNDGKPVKKGRLRNMYVFLGDDGHIRLGGRLMNSGLQYNERHPIVLPGEARLTQLLIHQAHLKTLHGGVQLTLSYLHRNYWVLRAKPHVKRHVRSCMNCFRFRAKPETQLMGQLPASRCSANRPFLHTGVDYAGPMDIRMSKGRGCKTYKGYVALFVCMTTKAIHLEAVSDLTTNGFIAAFQRFVSRRGLVQSLYSDNATNFRGAENVLNRMFSAAQIDELQDYFSKDHVSWVFIPPRSPHWGGLWEAGVKSMKHHLRRVVGDTTMTFEEMSTVLAQIEACLNSRPILPMSSESTDLNALTPGHFLVGHPLTSVPEKSVLDMNPGRLDRWKLIRLRYETFWNRWHRDYLHQLQSRNKWRVGQPNLEVGELVLLLEDGLPPTKWPLGRVTATHPGRDGRVRVADVQTSSGVKSRPIAKLALLPFEVSSK